MKLKTIKEIGLIACEYADQCQKNRPQIAWVLFDVKEAYKKGYTQAQQDLLSQASEGFEEWVTNYFSLEGSDSVEEDVNMQSIEYDELKEAWQAATLANEKKHQEELKHKQSVIDNLELIRESQLARIEELEKTVASQEKERQSYFAPEFTYDGCDEFMSMDTQEGMITQTDNTRGMK